tara:strand:- start:2901 stop:3545 length:645 start_codon:yes stop_codon:yes gene_type:complete
VGSEQFRYQKNGKIFSISNLSQNGMAFHLLDPEDGIHFTMGAVLEGCLNLHGEKVSVEAKVVRVSSEEIGCEWSNLSPGSLTLLESFLDPIRLGRSLKPMLSAGEMIWFHGPSGTDLLLHSDSKGELVRILLYLYQSYLLWEPDRKETGSYFFEKEEGENFGAVRFEMRTHSPSELIEKELVKKGISIIQSSVLPNKDQEECVRRLQDLLKSSK